MRWLAFGALTSLAACGGTSATGSGSGGTGTAIGSGGSGGAGSPGVGGSTAAALGLTPCRDLSPFGEAVTAAANSSPFLLVNGLGASVVAVDGWRVTRTFTGQLGVIKFAGLSADGSWGATAGDERALRLWRSMDGKETGRFLLAGDPAALAVSPAADLVAVADANGTITVVSAPAATVRWTATSTESAINWLGFTPDGRSLLVGTPEGFERRDVSSGAVMSSFAIVAQTGASSMGSAGGANVSPQISAVALARDGARLVVATYDPSGVLPPTIESRRPSDGSPAGQKWILPAKALALAVSTDGTQLIVATESQVSVYDLDGGGLSRPVLSSLWVTGVALSADGGTLAITTTGGTSFVDFAGGDVLGTIVQLQGDTLSADGRLALFSGGTPIEIWDPDQGTRSRLIERSTAFGNPGPVVFSPSNQLLDMFETTATLWDIDRGTMDLQFTLEAPRPSFGVANLLFTPDGQTLIGTGNGGATAENEEGQIRFWDAKSGALLRTLPGHPLGVRSLVVSRSGKVLVSTGMDDPPQPPDPVGKDVIKLWDVTTGAMIARLDGHTSVVPTVRLSNDGGLLLSGDDAGLVRLWSVPDGQLVRDLATPPTGEFTTLYGSSVAFSPDGRWAASAGWAVGISTGFTGVIAIWSVSDGQMVGRLLSPAEGNLGPISWSPDGRFIVSTVSSGTRVWCLDELPRPR